MMDEENNDVSDPLPATQESETGSDLIDLYMKEINSIPLLTAEQEHQLAQRVRAGDQEARRLMIMSNLRLVVSIAKKYIGRGVALLDLIEEGNLGLIRAVDKFDPQKGNRFSTYASWWIKQYISRAIADHGRTVRLPVHVTELINKWIKVSRQLAQKLGRKPTVSEVANEMGISEEKVKYISKLAQKPTFLETPMSESDDECQFIDLLTDIDAVSPMEQVDQDMQHEELMRILDQLKEKEREIIKLRFGLEDGIPRTLEEIGNMFNLTRERVRQIEVEAMSKIRRIINSENKTMS